MSWFERWLYRSADRAVQRIEDRLARLTMQFHADEIDTETYLHYHRRMNSEKTAAIADRQRAANRLTSLRINQPEPTP